MKIKQTNAYSAQIIVIEFYILIYILNVTF